MQIFGSLILFVVFIMIYLLIAEVFVMLFRITGLSDEKARFQVISMLTNSGYTTKEAEIILEDRNRRRLARFVMLFGYAFTVTIVSTVVNIFLQFRNTIIGGAIAFIPIVIIAFLLAWILKKTKLISRIVDKIIGKISSKLFFDENSNPIIIIDERSNLVIAKIELRIMPKELESIELSHSDIKTKHGINILIKSRDDKEMIPSASTTFELGDSVTVMGEKKKIYEIFDLSREERDNK